MIIIMIIIYIYIYIYTYYSRATADMLTICHADRADAPFQVGGLAACAQIHRLRIWEIHGFDSSGH